MEARYQETQRTFREKGNQGHLHVQREASGAIKEEVETRDAACAVRYTHH